MACAASHASAVICSTHSSRSASLCLIAWNCPMGRPNWTRETAWSRARSRQARAPPVSSAAAKVTHIARASSIEMPSRTWAGSTRRASTEIVETRRLRSSPSCGSTVTPCAVRSRTHSRVDAPSATATTSRSLEPDSTASSVPVTARLPSVAVAHRIERSGPTSATVALRSPERILGTMSRATSGLAPRSIRPTARAVVRNPPGAATRPSSSATRQSSKNVAPSPPSASETWMPTRPWARRSASVTSSGSWSMSRTSRARPASCSSANRRIDCWRST